MDKVGIVEVLKAAGDSEELKGFIMQMYAVAQKKIMDGLAGVYSANYQTLEERYQKANKADGNEESPKFMEIGNDVAKYLNSASIQYINNVIDADSYGVAFKSFDNKISFNAAQGFEGRDREIELLFDKLIEKYIEIHPESKEEILGDESQNYEFDGQIEVEEEQDIFSENQQQNEQTNNVPDITPTPNDVRHFQDETEGVIEENSHSFNKAESVVLYRKAIKKKMEKIKKEIEEVKKSMPKDKEVSLGDANFKKLLKYDRRYHGLEEELNRTKDPDYADKFLKIVGILNKPIAFGDDLTANLNAKLSTLEKLKPTLKAPSSKGITNVKIKVIKSVCKELNSARTVASGIQRGLILPKQVYEMWHSKYVAKYEAKEDYYDAIIQDVEAKLDTLANSEKIYDKFFENINKNKLKVYKRKKEMLDDFLENTKMIPIISITGSRVRSVKRAAVAKARNKRDMESVNEEIINEEMTR